MRAEDDEEQEAAAAAEAPAPAPDYGRSPSDPGQSLRRSDPSRRQSDPPPPEASVRSSSADAVQLITRRSSMLLSLIESEEKRIDLMEHPSQNPRTTTAPVFTGRTEARSSASQGGSQLKTATAAAVLASALSRGSSVLSTDSASQGGTPQAVAAAASCRRRRRRRSMRCRRSLASEEVLPPMPEPSTAGEEWSVDYSTARRRVDAAGRPTTATTRMPAPLEAPTRRRRPTRRTMRHHRRGLDGLCATASDRDSFASARFYSYV